VKVVLLHGNPETSELWDDVRIAWADDRVEAWGLPGFGCELPDDFDCSMDAYLAWLIASIENGNEPIHLIGHDWGGILTAKLAMTRPDLLKSWASDALGALHPRYEWHDAAQRWQTPEVGEAMVRAMLEGTLEHRARLFVGAGLDPTVAASLVARVDARMGAAMLALYRSAAQPALAQWGSSPEVARASRGAFIHATADPFVGAARGTLGLATTMGATTITLDGRGHWWMLEDPASVAIALRAWVDIDS
jgi:pimeloyl-ACP methyl ester carboxylesterase